MSTAYHRKSKLVELGIGATILAGSGNWVGFLTKVGKGIF